MLSRPVTNSLEFPAYQQLHVSRDDETRSFWCYFNPKPRPTFNPEILVEIDDMQSRLTAHLRLQRSEDLDIQYFVAASAEPSVFNLGGDLVLFEQLIEAKDRDGLVTYGHACVDAVFRNATALGIPGLTTISLVQGTALGGGFEAALSSHVLIAERSAQMGFPEILFNLFPGMGAYTLLSRRIGPAQVERLLRNGAQLSAEELYALGVVDVLVNDGTGVAAVRQFIRRHARARNGHLAIQRVRDHVHPLSYQELMDIVAIWADAALNITARDLRTMRRLANAQYQLPESSTAAVATPLPEVETVTSKGLRVAKAGAL